MTENSSTITLPSKPRKPLPSRELLKEFLDYNPSTGHFIWLKATYGRPKGSRAGSPYSKGYRAISILGGRYSEHRLAWLMHYGEDPVHEIDHENRVKSDNRIENLRPATQEQNMWNSGPRRHNRSGHRHIHWFKQRQKWRVVFNGRKDGKRIAKHSSFHTTLEAAIKTRDAVAKRLHGEFACLT